MSNLFTDRIDMDCKESSSYYILWLSYKKAPQSICGAFFCAFLPKLYPCQIIKNSLKSI